MTFPVEQRDGTRFLGEIVYNHCVSSDILVRKQWGTTVTKEDEGDIIIIIVDIREPTSVPAAQPRHRGINKYVETNFGVKVSPVERWEAGTRKNVDADQVVQALTRELRFALFEIFCNMGVSCNLA